MEKEETEKQCPECHSPNLITDYETGEVVCSSCGMVVSEQMVSGKSSAAYVVLDPEEVKKVHYGPGEMQNVHDKGLVTTLKVEPDARGNMFSGERKSEVYRLSRLQRKMRVWSAGERSLAAGLSTLDMFCSRLAISHVVRDRAAVVYRKALEKRIVRGRSIPSVIAGTLYLVCREQDIPRSLTDVAKMADLPKIEVGRVYRHLLKTFKPSSPKVSALSYLSLIAEKAGVPGDAQGRAVRILRQLGERKLTAGKDPRSLAAATLYIACRELARRENKGFVTQSVFAQAANITEVTVRNRYKDICRALGIDLRDGGEVDGY